MITSVIVIYNLRVEESLALRSLQRSEQSIDSCSDNAGKTIEYVIVDNSNDPDIVTHNGEYCTGHGMGYISMHGNAGLSAAYAQGVAYVNDRGANCVLISDQDSEYDPSYWGLLLEALLADDAASIYAPQVITRNGGALLSPSTRERGQYYINSGLVIRMEVFQQVQYDLALFLDFIDYDFCHSCYQAGITIQYLPSLHVVQDFSGSARREITVDYNRFQLYVRDGRYYYSKWYGKRSGMEMWIRCLHLCVMHRDLRFLGVLFGENDTRFM